MTAVAQACGVRPAAAWAGFAAMSVGMFMAILDVQVVATSLPTIGAALAIAPQKISSSPAPAMCGMNRYFE